MNWVFLTASFGEKRFHDSAVRLIRQAHEMNIFHEIIHVTERELDEYAPQVKKKYGSILNSKHPGFGYYSWKPEIVETALRVFPESGVIYVDAGCELNNRSLAKLHLKWILIRAKSGEFFHTLDYPERQYTKRSVLEYFSLKEGDASSAQFQATWFALSGSKGKFIAESWKSGVLADKTMIDDSTWVEDESYIEHRYDQSVLSCTLKSIGIKAKMHRPCHRPLSPLSKINCYIHPIWSARNRSGKSIISAKGNH